jgi:hypothetical protein
MKKLTPEEIQQIMSRLKGGKPINFVLQERDEVGRMVNIRHHFAYTMYGKYTWHYDQEDHADYWYAKDWDEADFAQYLGHEVWLVVAEKLRQAIATLPE